MLGGGVVGFVILGFYYATTFDRVCSCSRCSDFIFKAQRGLTMRSSGQGGRSGARLSVSH